MALLKERAKSRQFTLRETRHYVAKREVAPLEAKSLAEFQDIGSPGGPVVPRGQVRLPRR